MTSTRELLETFFRKYQYDRQNIYAWTEQVDTQLRDITARLEALEKQHPFLANSTTADQSDIQEL